MKQLRYILPLVGFLAIAVFLFLGLGKDPRHVPSPLVGKTAPVFSLPLLLTPDQDFSNSELKGKVWLLNVWGSWCPACRVEHSELLALQARGLHIVGLDWKDEPADAKNWLAQLDNPYQQVVMDRVGNVAIDFGVYGAPETFVIDAAGVIRHKHIGPITPEVSEQLVEMVAALEQAQ